MGELLELVLASFKPRVLRLFDYLQELLLEHFLAVAIVVVDLMSIPMAHIGHLALQSSDLPQDESFELVWVSFEPRR